MKITCGTDIIEIDRIKQAIEDKTGDAFLERVFSQKEIEYCESKKMQKFQHYAARFAGKEAVFKAISKYLDNKYEIEWKQIEILNDEDGRPYVKISHTIAEKIENIDISLSHCKTYATANVIVIYN